MIKLRIGKHTRSMPNLFKEIPLWKGSQIMEYLKPNPSIEDKVLMISLLSDIDPLIIQEFTDESIDTIWSKTDFHKNLILSTFYKSFKLKGQLYGLIDISNLTVKDYGDIEFWLAQGDSPFSYLDKIMETVYRPIIHKNTSPKNILSNIILRIKYRGLVPKILSSYILGEHTVDSSEIFKKHLDFSFGYGVLNYILQEFKKIKDEYKLLFPEKIEDEYEETENNEKDFSNMWGIYYVIVNVSQNLFERDAWMNKPIRELFKYLTFRKQENIYNGRRNNSER